MNNDLKQISDMQLKMNAKLNGIQKTLDSHTKKLDDHTKILDSHTNKLNNQGKKIGMIWVQAVHLTETTAGIEESLDSHTLGSKRNTNNIERVDKRVRRVENQLGIMPPPEFNII